MSKKNTDLYTNKIYIDESAPCERELSHAVAHSVLGWRYSNRQHDRNEDGDGDVWLASGGREIGVEVFNPVSNYLHTFIVVNHFTSQKIGFTLCYSAITESWTVLISKMQKVAESTWVANREATCESKSLGFAVCVAALRASGVYVDVEEAA